MASSSSAALSAAQTALIVVSVVVVVAVQIAAQSWGGELAISRAMGGVVGTLLIAGLIALPVYFLTRKRSLWPGAIVASVLMIALGGLSGLGAARRTGGAAMWRELDRVNLQTFDELRALSERGPSAAEYKSVMDRHIGALDALATRFKAREDAEFRVGSDFTRDVATIMTQYLTTLAPFRAAGGLTPESLKDKAGVTKRRALLKPALIMQTTVLSSFRQIPADLHNRFMKYGSSAGGATRSEQAMLAGTHFSQLLRIHELENELLVTMDEHLGALEASSSKWTVKGNMFEFRDQKALDAFNQRVQRIQSLAQEQTSVQEQMRPGSGRR